MRKFFYGRTGLVCWSRKISLIRCHTKQSPPAVLHFVRSRFPPRTSHAWKNHCSETGPAFCDTYELDEEEAGVVYVNDGVS